MHFDFLQELIAVFMISIVVILICAKFKIPSIVALLVAGIICGPSALKLVSEIEAVDIMAEVGVALLLFTIGMELSLKDLKRIKRPLLIGGFGQISFTILLITLIFSAVLPWQNAVAFGCLVTLSSTAIVLSLFQQKAQSDSPHGRVCLAILIFQDLVIVPIMLLFPLLSGKLELSLQESLITLGKNSLVIIGVILFGKFILPRLMFAVVKTRSRELMLMTVLGFCFSVALITASIGLSLSLGAFIAGLLLAESEYSVSIMENVLPFKEIFTSIFFISVGMLLNLDFFISHIFAVLSIAALIFTIKLFTLVPVVKMTGYSMRTAIISAFSMSQIGEFSFVLAGHALTLHLMDNDGYQTFLAASIITMTLTPYFINNAPQFAAKLLSGYFKKYAQEEDVLPEKQNDFNEHIIIIGFGIGGKSLAKVAKESGIPYVVSELNPDTVKRFKDIEPIFHGDASYPLVLEHLGVAKARCLAIMTSDPTGSRAIISNAKKLNPGLHIVVRTRFLSEITGLKELGADDVIPEEFETSIEVFAKVLNYFLIPRQQIEQYVQQIRKEVYSGTHTIDLGSNLQAIKDNLPDLQFASLKVEKNCKLIGTKLGDGILRNIYKINVAAIHRTTQDITELNAETEFFENDVVYVFGTQEAIIHVQEVFLEIKD